MNVVEAWGIKPLTLIVISEHLARITGLIGIPQKLCSETESPNLPIKVGRAKTSSLVAL